MKAKNKKIIAHAVGYTTAIGVTLAATIPFMFSASQSFMGGIHEVSFLSNVPNYRDKGFNEVSHDGMYNYARLTNQNVGVMGGTYSETGESYTSALNTLFDNGAKYVTAAGFNLAGFNWDEGFPPAMDHGMSRVMTDRDAAGEEVWSILLDDNGMAEFTEDESGDVALGSGINRTVSVTFASEEAGFFAGIAAAIYATYLSETYEEMGAIIGTWGGQGFNTVYSWMSGMEQAVNWFNYAILGWDTTGALVDGNVVDTWAELDGTAGNTLGLGFDRVTISPGDNSNGGAQTIVDYNEISTIGSIEHNDPELDSWYTGGFTSDGPADTLAKAKMLNYLNGEHDKKASVIFPVAGPQTQTALQSILDNSPTSQVIGVDVDAVPASPEYSNNILGSATKNLGQSMEYATWYAQKWVDLYDMNSVAAQQANDTYYDATRSGFLLESVNADGNPQTGNTDGWAMKSPDFDPRTDGGAHFEGTFLNQGVGFTDGEQPQLNESLLWLQETVMEIEEPDFITFGELMEMAFEWNDSSIEKQSWTFNDEGPSTSDNQFPWSIDWTTWNRI